MGKYWYISSDGKRKRTKAGYKHEYEKWDSTPERKKARVARNSARRAAIRSGRVSVGDNLDVHHSHGLSDNKHTRVLPASVNRGIHEKSRLKGSKRSGRHKKR